MSDSQKKSPQGIFPFLVLGAFLILGCVGIFSHEMWRDELQAWLIAKNGPDLGAVLQSIKFEGHPALWYIMLHFLSKLTSSLLSFQFFHLVIAAVSVYVFIAFAPFSKLQKVLFAFGYFPLYEYSIISRHYAIGVLTYICIMCTLSASPKNISPDRFFAGFAGEFQYLWDNYSRLFLCGRGFGLLSARKGRNRKVF